jgi:hypothetical protein
MRGTRIEKEVELCAANIANETKCMSTIFLAYLLCIFCIICNKCVCSISTPQSSSYDHCNSVYCSMVVLLSESKLMVRENSVFF